MSWRSEPATLLKTATATGGRAIRVQPVFGEGEGEAGLEPDGAAAVASVSVARTPANELEITPRSYLRWRKRRWSVDGVRIGNPMARRFRIDLVAA